MNSSKAKKVILSAVLVTLALSVFLNFFLYKQMKVYITELYKVELDPLGLSYFQNEPPQQSSEKPVVVLFGDSRAEYWPSPSLDGFVFINRGMGNQTSAQVANRFDEHVKPLRPDVVVIQVCINDLKSIPLFPERKQEIVSNCNANIQKIVEDSLELKATVIITTVIHPTRKISLSRRLVAWSDDVYDAVNEVNQHILSMAGENVLVFDSANLLSDSEGKTKLEYSSDHLHLNDAGYQALNLEFVKILEGIK
jgi:lysophospholipase L1-like esterase